MNPGFTNPGASNTAAFMALLRRDLLLAFRRRAELLQPLIFLLVVTSLFPRAGLNPANAVAPRPFMIETSSVTCSGSLRSVVARAARTSSSIVLRSTRGFAIPAPLPGRPDDPEGVGCTALS